MSSAVIIRTRLPAGLEALRRRSVADAADGLPAHLTMLYPFVPGDVLDAAVRSRIAAVARRHRPFDYRLAGPATWPAVVYAAVDPVAPFQALQSDLASAFPAWPVYDHEPGFVFIPHVTIAEGDPLESSVAEAVVRSAAWSTLPAIRHAAALEVIVQVGGGRWHTRWRIGLGGPGSG